MPYADLQEFFDPNLHLPIRGTTYTIPSPNAEEGLRIRALFAEPQRVIEDDEELAEIKAILGGVWDEMNAAGLSWLEICHAGRTALMHYGIGPAMGETHWKIGLGTPGNDLPPQPQETVGETKPKPVRPAAKKSTRTTASRKPKTAAGTTRARAR